MTTHRNKHSFDKNRFFCTWIANMLIILILAGCDALNVVQNAGDLKDEDLKDLKTPDSVRPQFLKVSFFDICILDSGGQPVCTVTTQSSATTVRKPEEGQVKTNAPVRLLVQMDKAVYLDEANQRALVRDSEKDNWEFYRSAAGMVALVEDGSKPLGYAEEGNNIIELRETAYEFFTTEYYAGHIEPKREGEFSITFPAGFVYLYDDNNNKVYNNEHTVTFTYDTEPPKPELEIFDGKLVIPNSRGAGVGDYLMSGNPDNFGELEMEINWGEKVSVIPQDSGSAADFKDIVTNEEYLQISCLANCVSGNQNKSYVYFGEKGSGRIFTGTKNNEETYTVRLQETDRSGDLLKQLYNDGTRISFTLAKGLVQDEAGNASQASDSFTIRIDNTRPELEKIEIQKIDNKTTLLPFNEGISVLGIGKHIDFELTFSEPVPIGEKDDLVLRFVISKDRENIAEAEVDFFATSSRTNAQLSPGDFSNRWILRYRVSSANGGAGDNSIGSDKEDFKGEALGNENWLTDISDEYEITSKNLTDIVLNPVVKSNFTDRRFSNDGGSSEFSKLHIDGKRPRIDTTRMQEFMRRLSGDPSSDTAVVAKGSKLVIAVPFSEKVYPEGDPNPLGFDSSAWSETTLQVTRHVEVDASDRGDTLVLAYDDDETQKAQTDPYFLTAEGNIIAYSVAIGAFARTESLEVISLDGRPDGTINPTSLQDAAGNAFDVGQATITGFSFESDASLFVIAIDGAEYSVNSVFPMFDNQGTIVQITEDDSVHTYLKGEKLYIGVKLSRPVKNQLGDEEPVKMRIGIRKYGETQDTTIDSNAVRFNASANGQDQSVLEFAFDLTGDYEDPDGVEIKGLVVTDADKLKDENGADLVTDIENDKIQKRTGESESRILTQVSIDTKAPICSSARLTPNASGEAAVGGFTIGTVNNAASTLYFALDCDQAVDLNNGENGSGLAGDTPFVYATFGPADSRNPVLFTFDSLQQYQEAQDIKTRLVYSLPIGFGFIGSDASFDVGERGNLKVTRYRNDTTTDSAGEIRVGEYDKLFTDAAGNLVELQSFDRYFVDVKAYDPDSTAAGHADGMKIDTRPFPIAITYPAVDREKYYVDSAGNAYLSGGSGVRSDGKNALTIAVDYGYYDESGDPVARAISLDEVEDLANTTIPISNSRGAQVGNAVLIGASEDSRSTLLYQLAIPYGTVSSFPLAAFSTATTVASSQNREGVSDLPYAVESLNVFATSGRPISPAEVQTQIHSSFFDRVLGESTGEITSFRINNSRPQLITADYTDGDYPIEVWARGTTAAGANSQYQRFAPHGSNAGNQEIPYGQVYIALVFDKSMDTSTFSDVQLSFRAGTTPISTGDLTYVDNATARQDMGDIGAVDEKKVFFRFNFNDPKYVSNWLQFGSPFFTFRANSTNTQPTDIYGNELDIATIAQHLVADNSYDIDFVAQDDIVSVMFNKTSYRFNNDIIVTVETNSRLNFSQNPLPLLGLQAEIDRPSSGISTITLLAVNPSNNDPTSADSDGSATMKFQYTVDDVYADQFNDNDIQLTGAILRCNRTATVCEDYTVSVLDDQGREVRPANLRISSVASGNINTASINSVLPKFVATKTIGDANDFVHIRYSKKGSTTPTDFNSANTLTVGDILYFDMPVTLQQNTTLQDRRTAGAVPQLQFDIFNLSGLRVETRRAGYGEVIPGNTVRFTYTVQEGDVVAVGGIDIGQDNDSAEQVLRFDGSSMMQSNPNTGSLLTRFTDDTYGAQLAKSLFDVSDDRVTTVYDFSGDLRIDARRKVTDILYLSGKDEVKPGDEVKFAIEFEDKITASLGVRPTISVRIGADTTSDTDVAIDVQWNTDYTSDFKALVFAFTVPNSVDGYAYIDAINLPTVTDRDMVTSAFIQTGNDVPVNLSLAALPTTKLDKPLFDAEPPLIDTITRVSEKGVYSKSSTPNELRVKVTMTKEVRITGINNQDQPSIAIRLDTKSGTKETVNLRYTEGNQEQPVTELIFRLPTSALPDGIQDYDGFEVVQTAGVAQINLAGASVADTAGNRANLEFTGKLNAIANTVNFDTAPPTIVQIFDETSNTQPAGDVRYKAMDTIALQVEFDETVDFDTNGNYSVILSVNNGGKELSMTLDTLPSQSITDKKQYRFTGSAGEGYTDFSGTISASRLEISSGATIQDKGSNEFAGGALNVTQDFSRLRIDAEYPSISAVQIAEGQYASGVSVAASVTFTEPVTVTGTPGLKARRFTSLAITPDVSEDITFIFDSTADDRTVNFTYTVTGTGKTDRASVLSPALDFSQGGTINDSFGNRSLVTTSTSRAFDVEIDPDLGASVESVVAYKVATGHQDRANPDIDSNANITKIDPTRDAVGLRQDEWLRLVVQYSENVQVMGNSGTMNILLQDDGGTTLSLNLIEDTVIDAETNDLIMFQAQIGANLRAPTGLRIANSTIQTTGTKVLELSPSSMDAKPSLTLVNVANDRDSNMILETITVNTQPPDVTVDSVTATKRDGSAVTEAKANDTIELVFTSDVELDRSEITVTIAGQEVNVDRELTNTTENQREKWTATKTITSAFNQGELDISIDVKDKSGNQRVLTSADITADALITIDSQAPKLRAKDAGDATLDTFEDANINAARTLIWVNMDATDEEVFKTDGTKISGVANYEVMISTNNPVDVGYDETLMRKIVDWVEVPTDRTFFQPKSGATVPGTTTPVPEFSLQTNTDYYTTIRAVDELGNKDFTADNTLATIGPWKYGGLVGVTLPEMADYGTGSKLDFLVKWDVPILVEEGNGIPTPLLTIIATDVDDSSYSKELEAYYTGGTGTNTLVFRYTVRSKDFTVFDSSGASRTANRLTLELKPQINGSSSIKEARQKGVVSYNLGTVDMTDDMTGRILVSGTAPRRVDITTLLQEELAIDGTSTTLSVERPAEDGGDTHPTYIHGYKVEYKRQAAAEYRQVPEADTMRSTDLSRDTFTLQNLLIADEAYHVRITPYHTNTGSTGNTKTYGPSSNGEFTTIFSPRALGARIWYEVKDIHGTGTPPSAGDVIMTLVDKSGNNNHARFTNKTNPLDNATGTLQASAGDRTNVKPASVAKFSGTNNNNQFVLDMSDNNKRTAYITDNWITSASTNTAVEIYMMISTANAGVNTFVFHAGPGHSGNTGDQHRRYDAHFPWAGEVIIDLPYIENNTRAKRNWIDAGGETDKLIAWSFRSKVGDKTYLEKNGVQTAVSSANRADENHSKHPIQRMNFFSMNHANDAYFPGHFQAAFIFEKNLSPEERQKFFRFVEDEYQIDMTVFRLSSTDLTSDTIADRFMRNNPPYCTPPEGKTYSNEFPELSWSGGQNITGNTRYSIIVQDLTAPTGENVHFNRFDIEDTDADTTDGSFTVDNSTYTTVGSTSSPNPNTPRRVNSDETVESWSGPCLEPGDSERVYLFRVYRTSAAINFTGSTALSVADFESAYDGVIESFDSIIVKRQP